MTDIQVIADEYINIAQENFGPMCSDWEYVGVEINDMGPHLRYYPEDGHVAISLSEKTQDDEIQLHFQLAHEVCHLLYPTMSLSGEKEPTTVLNEGVSTYFSLWATGRYCSQEFLIDNLKQHSSNYYRAMLLVHELLEIDREAIKKLRMYEPRLNRLSFEHFEKSGVSASGRLISDLLATFD